MRNLLVIVMVLLALCACAQAEELLVSPEGLSLTQAVAQAQPGDVIRLAAGVYAEPAETYPIVIDKPLTIRAEHGAVLEGALFKAVLTVEASDVAVEGVTFSLLRWGVVGKADRLQLRDCRFILADERQRVSSAGVWLAGAYDCTVMDCAFEGCGLCLAGPPLTARSSAMPVLTGLFEVGEDPALFTSHTIRNNTVNGQPLVFLCGEEDVVIPADAGQAIVVCCNGVTADGLQVTDSSMGLQIIHSTNVTVKNTTVARCGVFGVYLAYIEGGVLENVAVTETNHGIDLRNVQSVLVTDCRAEDCEQGIFLTWVFDSVVDRCVVRRCGFGFFASTGRDNQLSRTLSEDSKTGFYLQNEKNTLITGCTVKGSEVAALRVLRSGGQMMHSDFVDNWVGVLAVEAEPLTVGFCGFAGSGSTHVYMSDSQGIKLTGNTFDMPQEASVVREGDVTRLVMADNAFAE